MNRAILKSAIIAILKEREDEPAPEKYVMLALNVQFRIKVTFSELRAVMRDLDEKGFLVGVHADEDDILLWGLSAKGKSRALSAY